MKRTPLTIFTLGIVLICAGLAAAQSVDPLPSWHDGAAKQSIIEFVENVTKAGSPDFVPAAERIAVFDNDGTLWAERPMYFQLLFALDRVQALAPRHPEWQEKEPFASLLKGDVHGALADGMKSVAEIIMATHAGMTTEEFETIASDWIATAHHPTTKRPYTEMVYQPMLELLDYLRANDFKTFIVSGGGIEFMRPWTEKVYGIPPEQVVPAIFICRSSFRGFLSNVHGENVVCPLFSIKSQCFFIDTEYRRSRYYQECSSPGVTTGWFYYG
jgi:phosphoglycolate phosphatase-like HAD superfamily hydrolase